MRKQSIALLVIALVYSVASVPVSARHRRIEFETWDKSTRAPIPMPIEVNIEDNNCITIKFLELENLSVTLQIKDRYENVVYQDVVMPNENETYIIDLRRFKKGEYKIFYLNNHDSAYGLFDIE